MADTRVKRRFARLDTAEVAQEIADLQIYLAALADRLGVEDGPEVARNITETILSNEESRILR